MSQLVAVVGPTGSGKSTAVSHLDPKTTYVINIAAKPLPFPKSKVLYNADNKNYAEMDDPIQVLERLRVLSEKAPHIKNVIIDDANYMMGFRMVRKATEIGYTKFSVMAKDMVNLLTEAPKLRGDMKIYYFSHPEEVYDGEEIASYKMLTAGKLIDNQIKLEGLFTVCLYTHVEEGKEGDITYYFVTNRWRKYPAKSPLGMFSSIKIPNDLKIVSEAIDEYYS